MSKPGPTASTGNKRVYLFGGGSGRRHGAA